jgi:polyisoprenyl-phosphate glycosyltransferase
MSNPAIDFVVPCYNEEQGIVRLAKELREFEEFENVRIFIVDNGSIDGTRTAIAQNFKESAKVKIIHVSKNLGYGHGLKTGISATDSDWVGWFHADLQVNIESIKEMITGFNSEPSSIKGIRTNRSLTDELFTRGMSLFCSIIFGTKLTDINGQPTIYKRSILGDLSDAPADFSFDLYCLLKTKMAKERIRRVYVDLYPRQNGQSSWNNGLEDRISMSIRTFRYCLKLWGVIKFKK